MDHSLLKLVKHPLAPVDLLVCIDSHLTLRADIQPHTTPALIDALLAARRLDRHLRSACTPANPAIGELDCSTQICHLLCNKPPLDAPSRGSGPRKFGSSSSTHDGTMAEFEFEIVQISISTGLVDHPCNEIVESFDET